MLATARHLEKVPTTRVPQEGAGARVGIGMLRDEGINSIESFQIVMFPCLKFSKFRIVEYAKFQSFKVSEIQNYKVSKIQNVHVIC